MTDPVQQRIKGEWFSTAAYPPKHPGWCFVWDGKPVGEVGLRQARKINNGMEWFDPVANASSDLNHWAYWCPVMFPSTESA